MEEILEKYLGHIITYEHSEVNNEIKLILYSDYCPNEKDNFEIDGIYFEVDSVIDVTTDNEREEGLSYLEATIYYNKVK